MTTQVHQKISKINSDIERLIFEKENLKKKLKSKLTTVFETLNFEDFDFDDVISGLNYLKYTLQLNNENSKETVQLWKSSHKKKLKKSIKKDKQTIE